MQESNFIHITASIAQVIEAEEKLLSSLPVEVITQRRNAQNRTIKQILGHLIDSASNNHQRMVRLQYSKDLLFFPDYTQDNDLWIALQDYQNADWANLIQLWKCYNLHIIQVINSAYMAVGELPAPNFIMMNIGQSTVMFPFLNITGLKFFRQRHI